MNRAIVIDPSIFEINLLGKYETNMRPTFSMPRLKIARYERETLTVLAAFALLDQDLRLAIVSVIFSGTPCQDPRLAGGGNLSTSESHCPGPKMWNQDPR